MYNNYENENDDNNKDTDADDTQTFVAPHYVDAGGRKWCAEPVISNGSNISISNVNYQNVVDAYGSNAYRSSSSSVQSTRVTTGLTEYGNQFENESEAFRLLLDDQIINDIVEATNRKGFDKAQANVDALVHLNRTEYTDPIQTREWIIAHKSVAGKPVRSHLRRNVTLSPKLVQNLKKRLAHNSRWKPIDSDEFLALIGFQLLVGARHGKRSAVKDIFGVNENAILAFPAAALATSRQRLKQLNGTLSFSLREREQELRNRGERTAKIFDTYQLLCRNFQRAYNPHRNVVVDEQLIGYRGRFSARQYMPNKPDKIGIKQWMLVDANLFTYNMQVYTGREGSRIQGREKGQAGRVVIDMVEPLAPHAGYELTNDRFFTKLETAEKIFNTKGITMLGTMRIDNRAIATVLRKKEGRVASSTMYAYWKNFTVLSYCPKPGKLVPLLSSRHPNTNGTPHDATDAEIFESARSGAKPRMILDYNSTKGFVDTVDKMAKEYTAQRATRKWHHALWWRIVDIAAINAFIMFNCKRMRNNADHHVVQTSANRPMKRLDFLIALSMSLIKNHALRRFEDRRLSRQRRADIARHYGLDSNVDARRASAARITDRLPRKRCALCPPRSNNKTRYACSSCNRFACRGHAIISYIVECVNCSTTPVSASDSVSSLSTNNDNNDIMDET